MRPKKMPPFLTRFDGDTSAYSPKPLPFEGNGLANEDGSMQMQMLDILG
jgi:hypothetical protein